VISKRHPKARVDVLGYSLIDDWLLMDIRVHAPNVVAWVGELSNIEGVHDIRPLVRSFDARTFRVICKTIDSLATVHRLHLILRTPFAFKDGVGVATIAGPEAGIKRFIKMYQQQTQVQIEPVRNTELEDGSLMTPRQSEMIRTAVSAGYFEVPRHVTLSQLASKIGIAKSSLSEGLAIAERKIIKRFQEEIG
jgi:predicted DNA binding protein